MHLFELKYLQCEQYNMHVTLVCLVLASQIEFTDYHFYLSAFSGFHRGCTLGTLLATPPQSGGNCLVCEMILTLGLTKVAAM